MFKKTASTVLIFVLAFALVACSTLSTLNTALPSAAAPVAGSATALQNKLAVGILKLENSDLAVTSEQADILLLLWQGVKLLTSDKYSSSQELAALYRQIEETLTAEQVQAIQQVNWTQEEISALLKAAGGTSAQGSTARRANASSSSASQSQAQFAGGPGGAPAGGPGGNSDLALINGVTSAGGAVTQTTPTPLRSASSSSAASVSVSLNAQLAGAVIDLLQKRMAA